MVGSRGASREYSANRREFLVQIPGAAAITLVSAAVPFASEAQLASPDSSGSAAKQRVTNSFQIRLEAAQAEASVPVQQQKTNGDEQRYFSFIGNFSKGL